MAQNDDYFILNITYNQIHDRESIIRAYIEYCVDSEGIYPLLLTGVKLEWEEGKPFCSLCNSQIKLNVPQPLFINN